MLFRHVQTISPCQTPASCQSRKSACHPLTRSPVLGEARGPARSVRLVVRRFIKRCPGLHSSTPLGPTVQIALAGLPHSLNVSRAGCCFPSSIWDQKQSVIGKIKSALGNSAQFPLVVRTREKTSTGGRAIWTAISPARCRRSSFEGSVQVHWARPASLEAPTTTPHVVNRPYH